MCRPVTPENVQQGTIKPGVIVQTWRERDGDQWNAYECRSTRIRLRFSTCNEGGAADFDTFLCLLDERMIPCGGGRRLRKPVDAAEYLPKDKYVLSVSAAAGASGNYTLAYYAVPACDTRDLRVVAPSVLVSLSVAGWEYRCWESAHVYMVYGAVWVITCSVCVVRRGHWTLPLRRRLETCRGERRRCGLHLGFKADGHRNLLHSVSGTTLWGAVSPGVLCQASLWYSGTCKRVRRFSRRACHRR